MGSGRIMANAAANSVLRVIAGELSRRYDWMASAIGQFLWLELEAYNECMSVVGLASFYQLAI